MSLSGLFQLFSGLGAEGSAGVKATREKGSSTKKGLKIELREIRTPERQLLALALHYISKQSRRFRSANVGSLASVTSEWISETPRALVFLNLLSEAEAAAGVGAATKLVPTAAEFDNGRIVTLFDRLTSSDEGLPPTYPERAKDLATLRSDRQKYWKWFEQNFSATRAMKVVETAASQAQGRLRWIDYRLPLDAEGATLHLHCSPGGHYDVGTFAYNLIKRGNKHGLRIIGTLKAEPAIDVLAIYER
jgi:hypothetical protein